MPDTRARSRPSVTKRSRAESLAARRARPTPRKPSCTAALPHAYASTAAGTFRMLRPPTISHRTSCCSPSSGCAPVTCAGPKSRLVHPRNEPDDGSRRTPRCTTARGPGGALHGYPRSRLLRRPARLDAPRVAACLRALAERDRLVVLLTFYAEREAPRIAEDLGVSPGAVRVIRHRAMARLRDCVMGGAWP